MRADPPIHGLVYAGRDEPFLFAAGDCVQPPMIQHHVLAYAFRASSADLKWLEMTLPAAFETRVSWRLIPPPGDEPGDMGHDLNWRCSD